MKPTAQKGKNERGLKLLHRFIQKNRKSFPAYFRTKELKRYYLDGKLHFLQKDNEIIGFYVLDGEMFKSLFISKENRQNSSDILKSLFEKIKGENNLLTIAVNNNSKRVKKLCERNGFEPTKKFVKGKTHNLEIYAWRLQPTASGGGREKSFCLTLNNQNAII